VLGEHYTEFARLTFAAGILFAVVIMGSFKLKI